MWWQTLVLNWLKQFSALVLLIEVHKENRYTTVLNILMGIIAVDVLVLVGWIKKYRSCTGMSLVYNKYFLKSFSLLLDSPSSKYRQLSREQSLIILMLLTCTKVSSNLATKLGPQVQPILTVWVGFCNHLCLSIYQ